MDRRRLAGVAVLAAAVLAVAVGAGLGRPILAPGVASALPVDPPPRVGDCLYAGPPDWTSHRQLDGNFEFGPLEYGVRFGSCVAPWDAEVVDVRHFEQGEDPVDDPGDRPGVDGCAAGTALFVGRPDFADPDGRWLTDGPLSQRVPTHQRQFAAGQRWVACVLPTPLWDDSGRSTATSDPTGLAPTGETLRGQWRDPVMRDRWGVCGIGADGTGPIGFVFCGTPHDRERVAYTYWSEAPPADTLMDGCATQAARVTGLGNALGDGALASEVIVSGVDRAGNETLTAISDLRGGGSAQCWVRPVDPGMQLTATVVSLGSTPPPLVPR